MKSFKYLHFAPIVLLLLLFLCGSSHAQKPEAAKVELGSKTAKDGFKNETEIAAKFNNWQTDEDAKIWLAAMNFKTADIENVSASKPHGEKADVVVKIKTKKGLSSEGISIKLVSSPNGFNQIDKRWLSHYAKMWKMPPDVVEAMKLFLGEVPPNVKSRRPDRMFFNELDQETQAKVTAFFTANKEQIISDLFEGDGIFAAKWFMVALKSTDKPRWTLRSVADAMKFFGDGKVELTRNGNLKIGRITMQRKGGDGGRETAKMLQFKINPALIFAEKEQ